MHSPWFLVLKTRKLRLLLWQLGDVRLISFLDLVRTAFFLISTY